jgi:hypothetical protein
MVDDSIPYSRGLYNKVVDDEQWIRISEGCPNGCEYCRETKECGKEPIYFDIPEIVRNKVKLMDMNLMYKDRCLQIIEELGNKRVDGKVVYYELICGIDWRFMTQEKADALHKNRFKNIRFAWDWQFVLQYKIRDCVKMLVKAGYDSRELSCFMVCNWKIPYEENLRKLDLLKVWNVKVNDCWYDNQLSPNIKPIHWTEEQIKTFRRMCRKHNQIVRFGIDPECKPANFTYINLDKFIWGDDE